MADQAGNASIETELKFIFPADARSLLDRHPALQPSRATSPPAQDQPAQRQITTYYDTPDHTLNQHGFSLRVRQVGDTRIQTLKSTTATNGLPGSRGEWEWRLDADQPKPTLLGSTLAGVVLDREAANRLEPIFVTDINRTTRLLHLNGGTTVELAIDEGSVRCGGANEDIHELELELKQGPIAPLYRLALELHVDLPLRSGTESKSARGYRLATDQPSTPVQSRARPLDPDIRAGDGCRQIVGAALHDLLANRQAAIAGVAEGIHQMRIAVRRVRAAMLLFKSYLEPHALARFEDELRALGRVLGQARDWDVFCLDLLPAALAAPAVESWRPLLEQEAERHRTRAHRLVAEELVKPSLTRLDLGMAVWIEDEAERSNVMQGRLAAIMPDALDRLAHKVAKRGKHIAHRSAPELHALRKSLKKLRYGVLSVCDLFPHRKIKPYLRHCKSLQKRLGQINDAAMAARLAECLSHADRVDLAPVLATVVHWSADHRAAALRKLPEAWDEFRDVAPFWR